jgi:23S rRNA (pseudouridine1915-N3)-methyltransferase
MKVGIRVNIKIIAVGNIKEGYINKGIAHFVKKLNAKFSVQTIEISEARLSQNPSENEIEIALNDEGNNILSAITNQNFVVVCDILGKPLTSTVFSRILKRELYQNKKDLTFIIGGSHGLSKTVKKRANLSISFGKMTFPHQLMRLILIEQLSFII